LRTPFGSNCSRAGSIGAWRKRQTVSLERAFHGPPTRQPTLMKNTGERRQQNARAQEMSHSWRPPRRSSRLAARAGSPNMVFMTQKDEKPAPNETVGRTPAERPRPREIGGPKGPEPTRYGDWESNGRCSDF
jgi:hypothetical protein